MSEFTRVNAPKGHGNYRHLDLYNALIDAERDSQAVQIPKDAQLQAAYTSCRARFAHTDYIVRIRRKERIMWLTRRGGVR